MRTQHHVRTFSRIAIALASSAHWSAMALAQSGAEATPVRQGLEEIVITARRVTESLQSAPISVTAISAETLAARGLVSLTDIGESTPNVQISNIGSSVVFIRGVGQSDSLTTTDPGVAIYIDGVYIARQSGVPTSLAGVQRVEVLRGPQGTLFGKNSLGGAINVVTRDPTGEAGGEVRGRFGSRDLAQLDGILDFPVGDALAATLSAGLVRQDGYYHNTVTDEDLSDTDRYNVRGKLRWEPTPDSAIVLAGDYEEKDQNPTGVTTVSVVPGTTPLFTAGGAIPLLGLDAETIQTQYHGLYNQSVGCTEATATSSPDCFGPQYQQDGYDTAETDQTPERGENWGVSLTGSVDFGNAVAKSIIAYRSFDTSFSTGTDGSPLPIADLDSYDTQQQFSAELQLTGTALEERLRFTGGLYYFREESENLTDVRFLRTVPPVYPVAGIDDGTGNPLVIDGEPLLLPTQIMFLALNLETDRDQTTTSTAAYAQGSYAVTEALSLTAGLRANKDEKRFDFVQADVTGPPPGIPGVMDAASPTLRDDWSSFTPRLGIEYTFAGDQLLYLSWARGFKSGGFNARPTTNPPRFESYDPEELDTWELGLKSEWLDHRLRFNASAFLSKYKEIQLETYFVIDGQYITEVANAGDGTIQGLEVEVSARPHERLTVLATLGLLDFEYDSVHDVVGPGTDTPPGERLPFTSDTSWTLAADFDIARLEAGELALRLDYSHHSKLVFDTFNTNFQPSYGVFGGRLSFTAHDESWTVYLLGKNLDDEEYAVYASAFNLFGIPNQRTYAPPREWSVGFEYRM